MKKIKNGFTLIEIIGIIILLGVIGLLVYPTIMRIIGDSKEDLYKKNVSEIERLAANWASLNESKLPTMDEMGYYIKIEVLKNEGFIEEDIINPKTEEPMLGCVGITYDKPKDKYTYKYYDDCSSFVKPTLSKFNASIAENEYGWRNKDFYVTLESEYLDYYDYCIGDNKCEPNIRMNNASEKILINQEGIKYVCAKGTNKVGITAIECMLYRLDKTKPNVGKIIFSGTTGLDNWFVSDVAVTTTKSTDNLSGIASNTLSPNVTKITVDTKGTTYTLTARDLAGNESSASYAVKVDKTKPIAGVLAINGTLGDNGWYKSNVSFTAANGSDATSGHNKTTINISSITSDTKGTKVIVTTMDNAGNKQTSEQIVKVDKTAPIPGTLVINGKKGFGEWYLSDVTFKVNDGSDATSGHAKTTSTHTSVSGNTSGTVVTVTTTDKAGNTATRKYTIKINKDAPTAGKLVVDGTLGENGWYVSDVKLSVQDVTGVTSKLNITEITSDTAGTEVTMTSKNNTTGAVNVTKHTIKVDKTKPTVGELVISGTKGNNGWYKSNVTFSVKNGSDALSGHSSTASSISSITTNTKGTNVVVTTKDKAGNSATKTYTIKVDKTKPTITAKGTSFEIEKGTNKNSSTYFNTPKFGISGGSMNCSPATTGSLSSGTHTLTCTATGGNGNQAKATVSLVVKAMYADGSGANIPELYKNMVPIKYENNRWIVADLYSKWYDYNAKQWANAVVLNPGLTKAVGQEVTEEEVSLWYVWLPRYKYTVFNGNNGSVSEQLINVTFESGTNSTGTVKCTDNFSTNGKSEVCTDSTNGSIKNGISTYTHPAFTFGNTALKGIWIGKFELSATDSSCINDGTNIQCNKVLTIVTKPNVRSWMKAETVNFFTSIKNAATTYGISNADSHMIKNMEWGAAAYLKQSKYGLGNTIMKTNSNSSCYTGGGTGDAYKTNVMQSTTGNVYGVYDMSGGCFEYVMGFELNSNNQFNTAKSSFTTEPNFKYYDKYKYESVDYPQGALTFSRGKLGDATKETLKKYGVREGGWNGEIATFPYRSDLTFIRGGCYEDASNGVNIKAGIFYFTYTPVYAVDLHTTRAVLTAQ